MMNARLNRFLVKSFLFVLLIFICGCQEQVERANQAKWYADGIEVIEEAFRNHQSDVWVRGSGEIETILPDDLEASRHQRFIIRLDNLQTLLVVHNIDIALRVEDLQVGNKINFFGQYEWNSQGGLIHWTHRDPQMRYEGGWIVYNGKKYN